MTALTAAVVREAGGPFQLEDLELEAPRAGEVLVRILASGICHADLIAREQRFPVPLPAVLGHEGGGVVEAVGEGVESLAPGDPVLLSFPYCGECRMCVRGESAYCLHGFELKWGCQRRDGSSAYSRAGERINGHFFGQSSFASHTVVAAASAVKLDDDSQISTLAPLGCGIQTGVGAIVNSLRVGPGASVVIFGAGAVGLSAVMGARLVAAGPIVAVDVNPQRLRLARDLGATETIDPQGVTDLVAAVREAAGDELEFAVETTGRVEIARSAVDCLGSGGIAGMIGVTSIESEITLHQQSLVQGKAVKGILSGDSVPQDFLPRLAALHRRGELPVERLIERLPFAEIEVAARASANGEIVKPVLTMD